MEEIHGQETNIQHEHLRGLTEQLRGEFELILATVASGDLRQATPPDPAQDATYLCRAGLAGQALALVTKHNKFRVFLSSTYDDTACERDLLLTAVLPALRQLADLFQLQFLHSTMRWYKLASSVVDIHTHCCTGAFATKRPLIGSKGPAFASRKFAAACASRLA
jgi:hypothetical protein